LGVVKDGHAVTVNSQIVTAFDIWFPKDDRQRVLWPSTIRLSLDYWESLKAHARAGRKRALHPDRQRAEKEDTRLVAAQAERMAGKAVDAVADNRGGSHRNAGRYV
jgi:hypothetical protein